MAKKRTFSAEIAVARFCFGQIAGTPSPACTFGISVNAYSCVKQPWVVVQALRRFSGTQRGKVQSQGYSKTMDIECDTKPISWVNTEVMGVFFGYDSMVSHRSNTLPS